MTKLITNETSQALPSAWGNASKHGYHGTRVYVAWCEMKKRCTNPRAKGFENYGGRGIKVCDRWTADFVSFLVDMGEPKEGFSLDRIDSNGDYTPENCRWADRKTQNRNQRDIPKIEFNGVCCSIAEWSERTGIAKACIRNRIYRYGWTVESALTKPAREHKEYERNH